MIFKDWFPQIDFTSIYDFYKNQKIEIIVLVLAGLIGASIKYFWKKILGFISSFQNNRKSKTNIWKFDIKSSELKPRHLKISNFDTAFVKTKSFKTAKQKFFREQKNLLITGRSSLGKTRSAYEILLKVGKEYEILIPFQYREESYEGDIEFKKRENVILFVDDLEKYNTEDINYYLENLSANCSKVRLLCTCKAEYKSSIYQDFQIADLERYNLQKWTDNDGKKLASLLDEPFNEYKFDHTPASLFQNIEELKVRYQKLNIEQKTF